MGIMLNFESRTFVQELHEPKAEGAELARIRTSQTRMQWMQAVRKEARAPRRGPQVRLRGASPTRRGPAHGEIGSPQRSKEARHEYLQYQTRARYCGIDL